MICSVRASPGLAVPADPITPAGLPAVRVGGDSAAQPAQPDGPRELNGDSEATLDKWNSSFELPQSPHYGADGADGAPSLARSSDDPSGRRTPPGAAGDEAAAQKSWVRRVQAKTDELRVLFGLEPGEALMDDFMCALRKKVLLQGRLYVFERHLCFSSSLFGYHKTKVVPLEAVLDVRKRKNVGFPNSIEVTWAPPGAGAPKREFLTSFLSRQDAYRLVLELWAQHSAAGRERAQREGGGGATEEEEGGRAGSRASGDAAAGPLSDADGDDATPPHRGGAAGAAHFWEAPPPPGAPADAAAAAEAALTRPSMVIDTAASRPQDASVPEFTELPAHPDPSRVDAEFEAAAEAAPPLPPTMQRVLSCALPTSPRGFYRAFLASGSDFFEAFHQSQGHHSIKLSPWQRHYRVGPVRDLRFVTPLKGWRMGPPQALCHQTQRYRVYAGDALVFETSQVMADIPYGDHFKVETRWDVTPGAAPGTCRVEVHIAVPFTKSTLWRRFIEKTVTDSSLEAYQMFCELAGRQLAATPGEESEAGSASAAASPEVAPPAAAAAAAERAGSAGATPGHRRQPSRPSSPEEVLPASNEDWEALLAQVEPQWRGGLRSLRRTQLAGAGGSAPRHRRRGSNRSVDFHAFAASPRLPRLSESTPFASPDLLAAAAPPAPGPAARRWALPAAGVAAAAVIALQFALLALLLWHRPAAASFVQGAGGRSGGGGSGWAAVAGEARALAAQAQALLGDAQAWRGQLDALLAQSSALATRAERLHRAAAAAEP